MSLNELQDKPWLKVVDGEIKFIREHLLNHGANNWNLNQSYNVGKTSELVRSCLPKSLEDWESFYFENAHQNKKNGQKITREWITELGKVLYVKLSEVVRLEIESIALEECIDYMFFLVINRTYNGFNREYETVYGQLEKNLGVEIIPASDNIDRKFNVDFVIPVNDKLIGLQIKPVMTSVSIPQIFKERKMQIESHEKFTEKYFGKVFYVFSVKKVIQDKENLICEILTEIERLRK